MIRIRLGYAVPAAGLCVLAGFAAAMLDFGSARAAGGVARSSALSASSTTITVTIGKPSEFAFTLSKSSSLHPGPFVFKVTNRGKIPHNFKLCSSPKGGSGNACAGTVTAMLKPGTSAALKVTLTKGTYEYLCTVPGHAKLGMKGHIGVSVVAPPPPPPTTTTTPVTTTTNPTTTCASPQSTTVSVNEFEFGFTLSQSSAPCGMVTFNQTNGGQIEHNFDINGLAGQLISPGGSTTMTVNLRPGTYRYLCDGNGHGSLGMFGTFTVTG
jgi:nitrite reductase (NO-forming)